MSTTVILEIRTNPGTANEMLTMLKDILPDTRNYDGCVSVDVFQNQDDADTLIIMGKWQSKVHFETYLDWRNETGIFERFSEMIEGPPNTHFFNDTDA